MTTYHCLPDHVFPGGGRLRSLVCTLEGGNLTWGAADILECIGDSFKHDVTVYLQARILTRLFIIQQLQHFNNIGNVPM